MKKANSRNFDIDISSPLKKNFTKKHKVNNELLNIMSLKGNQLGFLKKKIDFIIFSTFRFMPDAAQWRIQQSICFGYPCYILIKVILLE